MRGIEATFINSSHSFAQNLSVFIYFIFFFYLNAHCIVCIYFWGLCIAYQCVASGNLATFAKCASSNCAFEFEVSVGKANAHTHFSKQIDCGRADQTEKILVYNIYFLIQIGRVRKASDN